VRTCTLWHDVSTYANRNANKAATNKTQTNRQTNEQTDRHNKKTESKNVQQKNSGTAFAQKKSCTRRRALYTRTAVPPTTQTACLLTQIQTARCQRNTTGLSCVVLRQAGFTTHAGSMDLRRKPMADQQGLHWVWQARTNCLAFGGPPDGGHAASVSARGLPALCPG
jgi:hypothetical protein